MVDVANDPRVLERREQGRFTLEAGARVLVFVAQDLERDLLTRPSIGGAEDRAHPAGACFVLELKAIYNDVTGAHPCSSSPSRAANATPLSASITITVMVYPN